MSLTVFAPLALLALAEPALPQGMVWVVDAQGGPGAFSTAIQPAIDAAQDGDTILVRSGTYEAFVISGKALVVAADAGPQPMLLGTSQIEDLASFQRVTLRGFKNHPVERGGLVARNNQGPLWLEFVELHGLSGTDDWEPGEPGLLVEGCSAVVLERCDLSGGAGYYSFEFFPGAGAPGLRAVASSLAMHDCTTTGGFGGGAEEAWGDSGGQGVALADALLFASGTRFIGGPGGYGGEDCFFLGGCHCYDGGPGGSAVWASGASAVTLLGCELLPGLGGDSQCASIGSPGSALLLQGGAASTLLPGDHRSFQLTSPAAEGGTTTARFTGLPGDLVLLGYAAAPGLLELPALGSLVLSAPFVVIPGGVLPASGVLQVAYSLPLLAPGVQGLGLFAQGAFLGTAGDAVLGGASTLLILDAGL